MPGSENLACAPGPTAGRYARVLGVLRRRGTATAVDVAQALTDRVDLVESTLATLLARGKVRLPYPGRYALATLPGGSLP